MKVECVCKFHLIGFSDQCSYMSTYISFVIKLSWLLPTCMTVFGYTRWFLTYLYYLVKPVNVFFPINIPSTIAEGSRNGGSSWSICHSMSARADGPRKSCQVVLDKQCTWWGFYQGLCDLKSSASNIRLNSHYHNMLNNVIEVVFNGEFGLESLFSLRLQGEQRCDYRVTWITVFPEGYVYRTQ